MADGAVRAVVSERKVEISPRVGSIPRRLTFPDGSVFETADNDGVDVWLRRSKGAKSGWVHGLEAFRPRLLVFVVAVIFLAFAIYRYAVPGLVEVAVFVTPPFVPEMIGSGALASLDRTVLGPSHLPEDERQAISDGFERLAAASEGGPTAYTLSFRDGGAIGPNAFALPGRQPHPDRRSREACRWGSGNDPRCAGARDRPRRAQAQPSANLPRRWRDGDDLADCRRCWLGVGGHADPGRRHPGSVLFARCRGGSRPPLRRDHARRRL